MGSNLGRSAAQAAGLVYSLPFLSHFRRGRRPGGQMGGGGPAARGKSAVGTGREKVVEMNKATKQGRGWGTGQTRKREAQVGRQRDDRPHCRAGSDSVCSANDHGATDYHGIGYKSS
ncbi:hypothetical protein PVAP13_3KG203227 [Panicum virgatum]|uniref:Uncharacterized protein n=1 Tax=Panicum virgatum TaxID=38727 RepID=A0A8T0USH5_PANVG|nr:hypothetical protein PVAP13_3KG203227 [Panicum virgatum]